MRIDEIIIVEGVHDKNALLQAVDATVIDIGGFSIFKDRETRALLQRLARERGVIILTDSDSAGFLLRGHLSGILPPDRVRHAYIPDVYGKERRKARPGKEGKLGVEAMPPHVLLKALENAGASLQSGGRPVLSGADWYELGLSGRRDSAKRREKLKKELELPGHMSSKALFSVLSSLYSKEELTRLSQ